MRSAKRVFKLIAKTDAYRMQKKKGDHRGASRKMNQNHRGSERYSLTWSVDKRT